MIKSDICVIGGGIIGSSVANAVSKRFQSSKIILIDREETLFQHNSSRNSGVLHSGIYYKEGTLKAQLCSKGNRMMKELIKKNGLWIRESGKVIVPKNIKEQEALGNLLRQGRANGANVELISKEKCLKIEPTVNFHDGVSEVLFTPDAVICDLGQVIGAVNHELMSNQNCTVMVNQEFDKLIDVSPDSVRFKTKSGQEFQTGHLINCSGKDALRIAKQFGVGLDLEMFFLKGYYLKTPLYNLPKGSYPEVLIYPVPPLDGSIFLGVHTTTTREYLKFGPNAFPALSGTHYDTFSSFTAGDLARTFSLYAKILASPMGGLYLRKFFEEVR